MQMTSLNGFKRDHKRNLLHLPRDYFNSCLQMPPSLEALRRTHVLSCVVLFSYAQNQRTMLWQLGHSQ